VEEGDHCPPAKCPIELKKFITQSNVKKPSKSLDL